MNDIEIRKRLKALVDELLEVPSEERTEEISGEIDELSPDPEWSDHIYHSLEFYDENDRFMLEGFLDKILAYKSIQL